MADQTTTRDPTAQVDLDDYLSRFDWHPEPELIGFRDETASRAALASLGERDLARGADVPVRDRQGTRDGRRLRLRRGATPLLRLRSGRSARWPGSSALRPDAGADVIGEYSTRLSHSLMNSQHPRQFGYFTPPPLPMSIMGELLAQVANQGVDVWHAGPVAAFVEEEVVRWLCDLVGYGEGSFGLLTSGGVMANFMGMALARDLHLGRSRGLSGPPRGKDLEGARVYTSDQTHFSIARALDELGFPPDTLVVLPADDEFHLRGAPVAAAITPRPGGRTDPVRDRGGRRLDEHGFGRRHRRTRGRRHDRRTVAARRCGVWRRSAPVGARSRPGHGSAIGRTA